LRDISEPLGFSSSAVQESNGVTEEIESDDSADEEEMAGPEEADAKQDSMEKNRVIEGDKQNEN
jgi:hypothetical protein